MSIKTIKYVPVDNAVAECGSKEAVLKRWEGLSEHMLNRFLREMRDNPKFAGYIYRPSHKVVMIDLEGVKDFMKWKTGNLFK